MLRACFGSLVAIFVLAGCSSTGVAGTSNPTVAATAVATSVPTEVPSPTPAPTVSAPTPTPGPTPVPLSVVFVDNPTKISASSTWTAIAAAWHGDPKVQAEKPLSFFVTRWSGCQQGVYADRAVACDGMIYELWTVYREDLNPLVYKAVDSIWKYAAHALPAETVQQMQGAFDVFHW